MTSPKVKNKYNNVTETHWHDTIEYRCSSFSTVYAVHKLAPVRVLIAEKNNYFMTSLWGKNEVQAKFKKQHAQLQCHPSLLTSHIGISVQSFWHLCCSQRGTHQSIDRYFMTLLWGKNEVKVSSENSMQNYNVTLVHWHHTLWTA